MNPSSHDTPEELWATPTVYRNDLFSNQVVMVSGGGSGIGRACAILAGRLGASIAVCGRTAEKLDAVVQFLRDRGVTALAVPTNVREPDQVHVLFDRVEAELGVPDVLINNAGGQFPQAAIDFTPKGWSAVINNNLNGAWFMMQRAAQRWRDLGRGGSIVNVVVVIDRGMPGVAHTVAARAGVIGVSRTVAVEWAPLNIRVNCVAPGLTGTSGLDVYPPEAQKEFPLANPMKRPGTPMEIAEACIYLAADGSRFVTGEVLAVDGGGRLWGELWTAGRPDYYRIESAQ